ncbi:MAG: hypothetical protein WAX69_13025 [Victivallales bacterium]
MKILAITIVFISLFIALTGCSTVATQFPIDNRDKYEFPGARPRVVPQIYSGTCANFIYTKDFIMGERRGYEYEAIEFPFIIILEIPFSIVGDTIVLPLTITRQFTEGNIDPKDSPWARHH